MAKEKSKKSILDYETALRIAREKRDFDSLAAMLLHPDKPSSVKVSDNLLIVTQFVQFRISTLSQTGTKKEVRSFIAQLKRLKEECKKEQSEVVSSNLRNAREHTSKNFSASVLSDEAHWNPYFESKSKRTEILKDFNSMLAKARALLKTAPTLRAQTKKTASEIITQARKRKASTVVLKQAKITA